MGERRRFVHRRYAGEVGNFGANVGKRRGKGGRAGRYCLVDSVEQDIGVVCGDEAACRKRVLAVDCPRAFLGLLRTRGANLLD